MPKLATWAAVAALALPSGGALAGEDSPAGRAAPAAPAAAGGAKRGAAGQVTFHQGGKAFQLPLETADLEVTDLRGRRQYHVSLVYRDAKNRTFALVFAHTGPGPVPDRLVSDLTWSTTSGPPAAYSSRMSTMLTDASGRSRTRRSSTIRSYLPLIAL